MLDIYEVYSYYCFILYSYENENVSLKTKILQILDFSWTLEEVYLGLQMRFEEKT